MEKENTNMAEQKKVVDEEKQEELTLAKLVGSVLTKNVELTKEEYNEMLKKIGLPTLEEEKTTGAERLERIKANYYGTVINMLFQVIRQYGLVCDELMVLRTAVTELCKKNGIDISELKTSILS